MAELFKNYVSDEEMIEELKKYHAFASARREGRSIDECPELSRPHEISGAKAILGLFVHFVTAIFMRISHTIKLRRLQEGFARLRIRTDELSYEPKSCGFHQAYTNLGIARLAQKDVETAIQSLISSLSIYPCPHSTSFGLSWALRNRLEPYPKAADAVKRFDVISRSFGGREWYRQTERTANKAL